MCSVWSVGKEDIAAVLWPTGVLLWQSQPAIELADAGHTCAACDACRDALFWLENGEDARVRE